MNNDIPFGFGHLEALLNLDGEIFVMDAGYWVKIEAKGCPHRPQFPMGYDIR